MLSLLCTSPASALEDEPDDRLSPDQRRLVGGLIQRGMPELVEELLSGAPTMHRVYIARAYSKAAVDETSPEQREELYGRAAEEYRRAISLSRDAAWLRGEKRRFDVSHWRVELGEMILRFWIARDLDQFEITSGLEYDAERLRARLEEARECYRLAGKTLEDLDVGLRTEEERYLLMGIAEQIPALLDQQRFNLAWTELYLGTIAPLRSPERRLLDEALVAFDTYSRIAPDEERKYQALLGAGIALRETGRHDESIAALERVI
ncbi:MAG TPA: hypothetical protein VNT79_06580, partial [Phycisphaerae bacterium]|nr:hypothetical protein [Phycisphaerae bacterium]